MKADNKHDMEEALFIVFSLSIHIPPRPPNMIQQLVGRERVFFILYEMCKLVQYDPPPPPHTHTHIIFFPGSLQKECDAILPFHSSPTGSKPLISLVLEI